MVTETQRNPSDDWRINKVFYARFLEGFADTQFGPIYLGVWGLISMMTFAVAVFVILFGYGVQVGFNPLRYVREFGVLAVYPPAPSYGLQLAPLEQGGYWQIATFFLTISVYTWLARIWQRALANKLRPLVAIAFTAAIFLFSVIYFIHPIMVGNWNEAPGHGLRAQLDWTNYYHIKYGNFYYNPFHMLSIFFLLGSTVILAMHAGTIWALEKYAAHEEWNELQAPGTGTERAQLFWRWCMGFNANAYSIHLWAFWFAWLCGVTGAIGVFLSMPDFVNNWFQWGVEAGINYPQPPPVAP